MEVKVAIRDMDAAMLEYDEVFQIACSICPGCHDSVGEVIGYDPEKDEPIYFCGGCGIYFRGHSGLATTSEKELGSFSRIQ